MRKKPTCYLAMATLLTMLSLVPLNTVAEQAPYWTSASGAFRVSYTSTLEPITINQIHRWTLHLETADGMPVANADIQVQGGMPAHDHGLPTSPRVAPAQNAGDYLVEGLRFHMPGYWELTLNIKTGTVSDTVLIPLEL